MCLEGGKGEKSSDWSDDEKVVVGAPKGGYVILAASEVMMWQRHPSF